MPPSKMLDLIHFLNIVSMGVNKVNSSKFYRTYSCIRECVRQKSPCKFNSLENIFHNSYYFILYIFLYNSIISRKFHRTFRININNT